MDERGQFHEVCTMKVNSDTTVHCLILNSHEGRAEQSLNKTDDCLGLGLRVYLQG